jgi:hypothetical protein
MVLELFVSLPIVTSTTEGAKRQQDQDKEEQYRMQDFHLDVFCNAQSRKRNQVDRSMVVLRDGKVPVWSFVSAA